VNITRGNCPSSYEAAYPEPDKDFKPEIKLQLDVDMVNEPPHYKAPNDPKGLYGSWDMIWAQGWGEAFAKGNALKYLQRCDKKGKKIKDLKKARTYIDMLIKKLEEK